MGKAEILDVIKNGSNQLGYPMGAMPPMMAQGADAEAIATYLAGGMKGEQPASFAACTSCHGADGKGMIGMSPNLAEYAAALVSNTLQNGKLEGKAIEWDKNRPKKYKIHYKEVEQSAKDRGCYSLDGTLNIGTIKGYFTTSWNKYDFIFDKKYYVETAKGYTYFPKNQKLSLVVRRTGKTRQVSLLKLYPYKVKESESEYSSRAVSHRRRYPSNKFKTLEVVSLVGSWHEICQ